MNEFEGRVAIITGAASGIGRALAGQCAALGMKLVLADVEEQALTVAEQEMRRLGARVLAAPTDVSRAADVEALAERAFEEYGAIHLLFNNAGVGLIGPTSWESTLADWEWVFGVNLWGVVHALRVFVPVLLEQSEASHIVNTSSTAGLVPAPGMAAYSAAKHALVSLSETLHHELTSLGAKIKVSILCPGMVDTRLVESERNRPVAQQNDLSEEIKRDVRHAPQLARIRQAAASGMSPDELARRVFEAIREDRLYVLTHPWVKEEMRARVAQIAGAGTPAAPPGAGNDTI